MTSGPYIVGRAPRLSMKPVAPMESLDGAWWPYSRDLSVELPALAAALATRLGYLVRVAYPIDAWTPAPRYVAVLGQAVRLDGFPSQDYSVLYLSGPARQRITVLVVPPEATDSAARIAMELTCASGSAARPTEILAVAGASPPPRPAHVG